MPDRPPRLAYLDHAATTPLRPAARDAMLPWLGERFGNPSGDHRVARVARQAVDEARDVVADVVGCRPGDVVFTGGGTEADNMAVRGVHAARPGPVLCSAIEHDAVRNPVRSVGGRDGGGRRPGRLDLDALGAALTPDVTLLAVMTANNEIGVVQPVAEAAELVRRRAPRAVVHTDAVQAASWLDLPTVVAGADLIAVSSHKVGGPQGVGALVARPGTPLRPLLLGGGQERELRSGTHNVAGIAGMAAALRAAAAERAAAAARVGRLRERLADGLLAADPRCGRDGSVDGRVDSRARCTCASPASRARRSCSSSTRPACARPPPRRAPAAPTRRRTCWRRWASGPSWAPGPCACRWDGRRPTRTSTRPCG